MKHPDPASWMAYLYDEAGAEQRRDLDAHLAACAECKRQVAEWRAAQALLDTWQLPARRSRALPRLAPVLRWGVAAALVLGLGIGIGRLAGPAPVDLNALKTQLAADLTRDIRDQVRAEVADDYRLVMAQTAQAWGQARDEDRQAIMAALERLDRQRRADHAALRKDLETVALVAEDRLLTTQLQLGELASYTRATSAGRPIDDDVVPALTP
jgi:hypothetical protein